MIEYIQGDLLDTDAPLIAHGVNCQNVMGSGVARALFEKWPRVKYNYHDYFTEFDPGENGEKFLGQCDIGYMERGKELQIANCFTQQYFGGGDKRYLSYDALLQCMEYLNEYCKRFEITEIAMPKIGCGLAGGNWNIVESILNSVFTDIKVKVYIK